MRPAEILDAKIDLMTRLTEPDFARQMNGMNNSGSMRGWEGHPDMAAQAMWRHLSMAEAFRVSHDMSIMVEHAANQLDGTDAVDHTLAPTSAGLVCFDRPLPVMDVRGQVMLLHWLGWGPQTYQVDDPAALAVPDVRVGQRMPGVLAWMMNDTWRQPDDVQVRLSETFGPEVMERLRARNGRWATIGLVTAMSGLRLGPVTAPVSRDRAERIRAEGDQVTEGTNAVRYLHALWLLLGQTISKAEVEVPDRAGRRRAAKAKIPARVTVIRMRREKSEYEPGETTVNWQHRWVVRGHWRWTTCGPEHPLAQEMADGTFRARIWIMPYVKGPEDRPFSQTEKVYSLDR